MSTTAVAPVATEQATKLRKRIADLSGQRRETEGRRAQVRDQLSRVEQRRTGLIAELATADGSKEARLQSEISKLDSEIVALNRKFESLSNPIAAADAQIGVLGNELREVEQSIAADKRAAELKAFQSKMEHAAKTASDALATARESLAALNKLAAQGSAEYGDAGLRIAGPVVEAFVLGEANLDARGWKPSTPSFSRIEFWVRSMTRG